MDSWEEGFVCARNGKVERMTELLDEGLDPNCQDDLDRSFLIWASVCYSFFKQDTVKMMELLLEKGSDPNHECQNGWTPLILCVQQRNVPGIRLLLNHGADPKKISFKGKEAFDMSCTCGFLEGAEILLEAGADPTLAISRLKEESWPAGDHILKKLNLKK